MFGVHYLKTDPTHYVIHYHNGRLRRAGPGLAFFYYRPTASIAIVPLTSADVPFIFNELSADFQPLTVQGQLTYRISDPKRVADLLDYTIKGALDLYVSDDPGKLPERLVNLVQVLTRAKLQDLPLRQAIHASDEVSAVVRAQLVESEALQALGVAVLDLAIQAIRPTPEIGRALEADAREALLRQADQATYDRRNAAVEQERRIKENELNTEIAVEDKKRQIRETKVDADLAVEAKEQLVRERKLAGQVRLEEDRKRLVAAKVENARTEADVQAYAITTALHPLRELEPELLQALAVQSADPRRMVSQAVQELARNASKIGNLNLSPELLETLLKEK
jgi:hypothetical protein